MIVPRPDNDEYLMAIAVDAAARCNCRKTVVGAVIVRDGRIISTGYNGTIAGYRNCIDGGCPRCEDADVRSGTQLDRCICVHAEQNALLNAARFGVAVGGAECWVTNEPCLDCTKTLIQAHIARVVYWMEYPLPEESRRLRDEMRRHAREATGIAFVKWTPTTNVLDLEQRYRQIQERLDAYVQARALG
jgi:dCMP deaminase